MQSVLHLDDRTVAELVDPAAAQRAVDDAFAAWGRGEAATTQRIRASAGGGMASAMAAVVHPYCGGKLYATNAGRFTFLNALFHTDGTLLATLDGDAVTALRTAAASSLAIHHLAAPHADVATLIGTGHQAWPHVAMILRTLPELRELRICGRDRTTADELARHAREAEPKVTAHTDPLDAVAGAHVVVTVTSASEPLFPATAVSDDTLVCAVGATKYDRTEIDPELVARCAAVVCDDVTGSRAECGDLINAVAAGRFDWGDAIELNAIAAGTINVPRAGAAPVLFETQGVAIQDVAVCALAYERHLQRIEIKEATDDHVPPTFARRG
jgi:ornithine cyclodeaminase/alanine dehydrogenase-like protein (mu-crystallin family)